MRCCHLGEIQIGNYQREQFQLVTTLPKQKLSPYTMALTQTACNFHQVWGSYTRSVISHGGIYWCYGALPTGQDPIMPDNTQTHNKKKVLMYTKALFPKCSRDGKILHYSCTKRWFFVVLVRRDVLGGGSHGKGLRAALSFSDQVMLYETSASLLPVSYSRTSDNSQKK